MHRSNGKSKPILNLEAYLYGAVCLCSVYRGASFLQGRFHGQIHRRKLFIPEMNCFGSFWVLYQSVIALPTVLELMNFHFNFHAFVDTLNHVRYSPQHQIDKRPTQSALRRRFAQIVARTPFYSLEPTASPRSPGF